MNAQSPKNVRSTKALTAIGLLLGFGVLLGLLLASRLAPRASKDGFPTENVRPSLLSLYDQAKLLEHAANSKDGRAVAKTFPVFANGYVAGLKEPNLSANEHGLLTRMGEVVC